MPEFIQKSIFRFILMKIISGHESRDDHVTVNTIGFNQNTLSYLAPTHTIGPIKYE